MENTIQANKIERIAEILKTVAHPTRLSILQMFKVRETITVNEIAAELIVQQPIVSHHLGKMKDKGVLQASREGRTMHYSLTDRHMLNLLDCMENCDLF